MLLFEVEQKNGNQHEGQNWGRKKPATNDNEEGCGNKEWEDPDKKMRTSTGRGGKGKETNMMLIVSL